MFRTSSASHGHYITLHYLILYHIMIYYNVILYYIILQYSIVDTAVAVTCEAFPTSSGRCGTQHLAKLCVYIYIYNCMIT